MAEPELKKLREEASAAGTAFNAASRHFLEALGFKKDSAAHPLEEDGAAEDKDEPR
jgi:hypothetical protein